VLEIFLRKRSACSARILGFTAPRNGKTRYILLYMQPPDYYRHHYVLTADCPYEAIWAEAQQQGSCLEFYDRHTPMIVICDDNKYNTWFRLRWGDHVRMHYTEGWYEGFDYWSTK